MSGFLRVVTGGSHREMGFDLGRATGPVLGAMYREAASYYSRTLRLSESEVLRLVEREHLPHIARRFPKILDEVRGIAEGAGMPLLQVLFLTIDDEMDARAQLRAKEHCSSAFLKVGTKGYLAHNEDYPPRYRGRLVVVDASPDDAPRFMALTYPYMLGGVACTLNETGFAFAANSFNFPPEERHVPANYPLRAICGARGLADVRRILGAAGGPYVISVLGVSKADGAFSVESTPHGIGVVRGDGDFFAHTNHVISGDALRVGEAPSKSSLRRYAALSRRGPSVASVSGLKRLFASTKDGLLRTTRDPGGSCTLATAVLDLAGRAMYVSRRGPGGGGYRRYDFSGSPPARG